MLYTYRLTSFVIFTAALFGVALTSFVFVYLVSAWYLPLQATSERKIKQESAGTPEKFL